MIVRTPELEALDLRWEREAYGCMSFSEALDRFGALWEEAVALQADPIVGWKNDVESTLAVARAVNGLPPA